MQTTLLGLAIALILALIAALIGPYFIDWNQFRPQFEAEATRIIGAPVRVSGELQARLLPTPTLRLGAVAVGGPNDLGKVRADRLEVEFSLGELMRGQWRANELTIGGLALDLGLDRDGRIDWPASNGTFNWASLSIDRLNLTGRAALHDAASRSTLELNDIAFSGDVRSAAGAVRGDGNVTVDGTRYPFRISSGQSNDGSGGTRLHLNIDPGQRPVTAELEGLVSFDARAPRFDGSLTLAMPPPPKGQTADDRTPWKVTTKLKADHSAAQLDQIDGSYGSEERAVKFAGTGEMRFGAAPLLHAALSARQFDADRLVAGDNATDPVRLWPTLRALTSDIPHPPLPVRIEASCDQIMLGGRPLQNLSAEFRGDRNGWSVDRLDLRAPGTTVVSFGAPPVGSNASGVLDVDSADPDALMVWLRGRGDLAYRIQKPLRLHGNVAFKPDGVSVDGLKAEIEGGTVGGSVALAVPSPNAGLHLDAALTADQLDLDAATTFVRALAGPAADWPAQAAVSLNVARARLSGQELRPFTVKFSYSPKIVALEQLNIGQGNGINIEGSGSFDRSDASGILTLRAGAPSLSQLTALVAPFAPNVAGRLTALGAQPGLARIKLVLDIGKDAQAESRAAARAIVDLSAPQLQGNLTVTAKPELAAVKSFDLDRLRATDGNAAMKLVAAHGDALVGLLGLDKLVAAGDASAQFEGSVSGSWSAPLQIAAKISGAAIDADAQGSLEPWGQRALQDIKGSGTLRVRKANLAPLFGLKPQDNLVQNIGLSSHVTLAGNRLTFDDLDSANAGSRLRGHLAVNLGTQAGEPKEVEGEVGLDTLELGPALALAIGAAGHGGTEPLSAGLSKGWRGRIAFEALRGVLPDNLELRPVSGAFRSDGQSITFEGLKGKLGGGEATATIDARDGANGLALNASVELKNVDGAALHYRNLKMPSSRVWLQMSLQSQGRSVAALTGALSGNGTVTLQGASLVGLDPRAFEVAIRASDAGQPTDEAKLKQLVEPVLASGAMLVPSAQIPFTIRDGRLRVGATTLDGEGVRAIVSGGYDIPADQADVRATLSSTTIGSGSSQPEIQLFLAGPPGALTRNLDVTSLSSWLAVRVIDRETRRLDAIEHGQAPPSGPPAVPPSTAALPLPAPPAKPAIAPRPPAAPPPQAAPSAAPAAPTNANPQATMSQQLAPLPPPIDVRPPPGPPPAAPRPKLRPPLVLTPPPTVNQ